jgi:hypothetical protein
VKHKMPSGVRRAAVRAAEPDRRGRDPDGQQQEARRANGFRWVERREQTDRDHPESDDDSTYVCEHRLSVSDSRRECCSQQHIWESQR